MMDEKFKKDIETELKETTDPAKLKELEERVDASLADMKIARSKKNEEARLASEELIAKVCSDLEEMFKYSDVLPTDIKCGGGKEGNVYGYIRGACAGQYELVEMSPDVTSLKDVGTDGKVFAYIGGPTDYWKERKNDEVRRNEYVMLDWEDTKKSVERGTARLMKKRMEDKIKKAEAEESYTDEAWDRFCGTKA